MAEPRKLPRERSHGIALVSDAMTGWTLDEVLAVLPAHDVWTLEPRLGIGTHLSLTGRDATAAARRIEDAGLALCGVGATSDHPLGHPGLDRVVDVASELGAAFVRIFPPAYDQTRPAEQQLQGAASALRALRERGAPELELLLEPCQDSLTPSAELALRVLRESAVEGIGVVFDPANMVVEGNLRHELAVDLLGGYLRHVHVKNVVVAHRAGAWHPTPATLDDGHVDWADVLASLARARYDGWLSIDHLSGAPSSRRLCDDVATLRQIALPPEPVRL